LRWCPQGTTVHQKMDKGDGALAGRPSIVSDYISIILQAIEKTRNDPAQLRGLVYDLARLSLGKQLLTSYHQFGSAGLQQHVLHLETAINQVENIALKQIEDLSQKRVAYPFGEGIEGSDDLTSQLIERPVGEPDHIAVVARDAFDEASLGDSWSDRKPALGPVQGAELLPPLKYSVLTFGQGPKRAQSNFWFGAQLVIATLIGMAIYAALWIASDHRGDRFSVAGQATPGTSAVATQLNVSASPLGAGAQALGFSLPSVYGVYAVSEGKLHALDPLQLKVPDPRVAISAIIPNPSRVKIPDGKVQFVIFRRDLISSAPTEVFVRVVARVAREMKFNEAGRAMTTNIDDQWAIRSKSYEFSVVPLGDNPEMIVLHPADPQLILSPGRYALVVAGKGYDFTVDGQVTDTAQCLERTDVIGGAVYSECRTLPSQLAN
jgi:hypothetical protein